MYHTVALVVQRFQPLLIQNTFTFESLLLVIFFSLYKGEIDNEIGWHHKRNRDTFQEHRSRFVSRPACPPGTRPQATRPLYQGTRYTSTTFFVGVLPQKKNNAQKILWAVARVFGAGGLCAPV
jgi:hypothetical protein